MLGLGIMARQSLTGYSKERTRLEEQKILNQAVFECGQIGQVTWENDNTQVTEPYEPAYEKCLKDKKIK